MLGSKGINILDLNTDREVYAFQSRSTYIREVSILLKKVCQIKCCLMCIVG